MTGDTLERAAEALRKVLWIDDSVFRCGWGPLTPSHDGDSAEELTRFFEKTTRPLHDLLEEIERRIVREHDRWLVLHDKEKAVTPTRGRRDELGQLGRVMGQLVQDGESATAVARFYVSNFGGKGVPLLDEGVLLDRLRKRKKSTSRRKKYIIPPFTPG